MLLSQWAVERSPFSPGAKPLFYEGESQVEALARLRFAVQGGSAVAIFGAAGSGKSALLAEFARQCRRQGRLIAKLDVAGASARDVLWETAAQWALGPRPDEDTAQLFRRLTGVATAATPDSRAVLLVDEVDQASVGARQQLSRLIGADGAGQAWLTVVGALRSPAPLPTELADRIDLRIDLEPWSQCETIGYLQHALVESGCDGPVFDDEAMAVLHTLSEGLPRRVNRLAEYALLGAAAAGLDSVDAGAVEAAHDAVAWAG